MIKELALNMDIGITTECWTFYRLAILLAYNKYYPWYLHHLNRYYIDSEMQFTFDINKDMVTYYEDVIQLIEVDGKKLISNIINGINKNHYFMVYVDRFYVKKDPFYNKQRYLHELLIYGYDSDENMFLYIDINNKKGTYEKYKISFDELYLAHHAWVDEFYTESRQNRWVNNFLSVHGLYPANEIVLRQDVDNDLKLHLFLKDIQATLNGNAYIDKKSEQFKYTGVQVYDGYKEKLLNKLLQNVNYLHEGNDIERGKSNFWVLSHFKGMYESKYELEKKLVFINSKTKQEIFNTSIIKRVNNLHDNLKLLFELLWKFFFKSDINILEKIEDHLTRAQKDEVLLLTDIQFILINYLKQECEKKYS